MELTEHLINRPAVLANCVRCGQLTFTGISGGLTVAVDLQPLGIAQEITARITGKSTYDLVLLGRRVYLEWRDMTRVRAPRSYAVAAIHQCRGAPQRPVTVTAAAPLPGDPPF